MLPFTSRRVRAHGSRALCARIRRETEARLAHCAAHPEAIERRLAALEREWDLARTLETNGTVLGLAGLALGASFDRRWLFLTGAVLAFSVQHALQGWCAPLVVLRRLGVRTRGEIEAERAALEQLRAELERAPAHEATSGPDILAVPYV